MSNNQTNQNPIESSDLVDGLLSRVGVSLIHGEPGGGKSFLALDLAASVATGSTFHGRAVLPGAVLYFCNTGNRGIPLRRDALLASGKLKPEDPVAFGREYTSNLLDEDATGKQVGGFELFAKEKKVKPRLAIFDAFCFSPWLDMDDPKMVERIENNTLHLAGKYGIHILLTHHHPFPTTIPEVFSLTTINSDGGRVLLPVVHRDRENPGRIQFSLKQVVVGLNSFGGDTTSCVVQPVPLYPLSSGRPKVYSDQLLLDFLPATSKADWYRRVEAETGMTRPGFYRRTDQLIREKKVILDKASGGLSLPSEDDELLR